MSEEDLQLIAEEICRRESFHLQKLVGEGAYKKTYHVKDQNSNSLALKIYKSNSSSERTKREIKALLKCNHPNIAKLFDVNSLNINGSKYTWILEEFLDGGTLTDRLRSGNLGIRELEHFGRDLIDAISYLSSLRYVHRDIKPDNIMFKASGTNPILVDFGIVRILDMTSYTATFSAHGP